MVKEVMSAFRFYVNVAELWLLSVAFFIFTYIINASEREAVILSVIMASAMAAVAMFAGYSEKCNSMTKTVNIVRVVVSIVCGYECTHYLVTHGKLTVESRSDLAGLLIATALFAIIISVGISTFYAAAYVISTD